MEVLLHFTIPFIMLTLLGVKPRKALPLAVLGILPDLDALFLVHRSLSHSLIIIILVAAPFFLYSLMLKPQLLRAVKLGFLSIVSHPLLDTFSGHTPILWPLYPNSLHIQTGLNAHTGSGVTIHPMLEVSETHTIFQKMKILDGPLFTSEGLIVSLILVAPLLYRTLNPKK